MHPDQLPGIRAAALVIVRGHAVDKKAGALFQLIELLIVHQDAAAGENQDDQKGFQVFTAGHMALLKLEIPCLLHVEKGRAGEGPGRLDHAAGAFHIRIGETVKIIIHTGLSFLDILQTGKSNIIPVFGNILTC